MGDIYVSARPTSVDPNALNTVIPQGTSLTSDFLQTAIDAASANGANSGNAQPKSTSSFLQDAIDSANATAAAKGTGSSAATDIFADGRNPFKGPSGGAAPDIFASGANPFIGPQDTPRSARPLATPKSIAANLAAGVNEGAIDMVGAPVDLVAVAINFGLKGLSAASGANIPPVTNPVGGSQWFKDALGRVGMSPDEIQANQPAERIARGVGAGAAGALMPEIYGPGLAAAGATKAARFFQDSFGGGSRIANAAIGGVAGGAGEGAAELAPDALKPTARLVGNLVGGGIGAVAAEAPAAAGAAYRGARDYVAPMTTDAQKLGLAQRTFAGGVADRGAALDAFNNEPTVGVGDVPRTSYQVSGDSGVGAMERAAETAEPGPFNARRAAQNDARVGAIRSLQPEGDPAAVGAHVRDQLAEIDAMTAGIGS